MTEPLDPKTELFLSNYSHKDGSHLTDAEKDAMRDMIIRGRTYELSPPGKKMPTPKPLPPPVRNPEISAESVGKYAILESIGEGASAYVFKGSLIPGEFGPEFAAVKFPKSDQAVSDLQSRERILSALGDCPYFPHIVDKGVRDGRPFIAEEFRERTLAQLIAENETKGLKPTPHDVANLAKHLLRAIDYTHRLSETNPRAAATLGMNSLPHCDIKPSNILEARDSRTGEIFWQYTDSGIKIPEQGSVGVVSSVWSASLESVINKSAEEIAGAKIYVAPEVRDALLLGNTTPTTQTADLWSIGATLFAYAIGRAPTWGETTVSHERPDLQKLDYFFKKMLSGDPRQRFESAKEALLALGEHSTPNIDVVPQLPQNMREYNRRVSTSSGIDSYIIGFRSNVTGRQIIFSQPMFKGSPTGELREETTQPDEHVLMMLYAPPPVNCILTIKDVRREESGGPVYHFILLDAYHCGSLSRMPLGGIDLNQRQLLQGDLLSVGAEVIRNATNGELVFRSKVNYIQRGERRNDKTCVSLTKSEPVPYEASENREEWGGVEHQTSFGTSNLKIRDAPFNPRMIFIYDKTDPIHHKGSLLGLEHVSTAMWVPKSQEP